MSARKQEVLRQTDDTIFVLDIGTRSIIGLVGVVEDEKLNIIAVEAAEHQKRAMIDGQIEDINAVAKLAVTVKERIEEQLDMKLTRVCVAAAGRALKTERTTHEMEIPEGKAIDAELINQLESGAIEKIEDMLKESSGDMYKQFYLVGYSAIQYYLDEYPISSLLDHHGSRARADILATFLPSEVVESLYAAMQKAGLEVASLTLEPIAAINAAIPENLRLLNLCFVDIGAGTSDIAICKDGNIVGYTMATIAGDEITEALMKEYLIDFNTAEQIKMELDSKKEIYFTDVMGFEQSLAAEDMLESISGQITQLCQEIAGRIQEVNGGSPSAVFLGGGGSKLKGVLEGVTEALAMDEKRVAIAGSNFKATSFSKEYDLNNPEYATPLGIAVSTGLNLINDSCHVTLNGRRAKLFRNGQLNVLNVLTMNGYRYRDLFGRSGASLVVTVNGKRTVFYGKPATNSTLMLNGNPAGVDTLVQAGDVLEFIPAQAGEPAQATVRDAIGDDAGNLETGIRLNGEPADLDTPLKAGDVIATGVVDDEPQPTPQLREETAATEEAADQSEAQAEIQLDQGAGGQPEKPAEAQKDQRAEVRSAARSETGIEPQEDVRSELREEIQTTPQGKVQPQMRRELDAEPRSESQRESRPVMRPENRLGTRQDATRGRGTAGKPGPAANQDAAAPQEAESQQEMKITQEPKMAETQSKPAPAVKEETGSMETVRGPLRRKIDGTVIDGTAAAPAASAPPVEQGAASAQRPRRAIPAERRRMPAGQSSTPAAPVPVEDKAEEGAANGSLSATFGSSVPRENVWRFILNDKPVSFPAKPGNAPYLLLDMLEHSGLDFDNLTSPVVLAVNGMPGVFQQRLRQNDSIIIRPDE